MYIRVCTYKILMKTQGETEKGTHTQTHTHTGALSTAPFQWLTRSARETDMERRERLRQTGDVHKKTTCSSHSQRTGKNKQKNKQKFVRIFSKFQFCF